MSKTTALRVESAGAARNEEDRVFSLRCEELRAAGFCPEAAALLAASPNVDLRRAIKLRTRHLRAV